MSLNREDLEYYFSKAKEENRRFIQVMIMMPGFESPEFIIKGGVKPLALAMGI